MAEGDEKGWIALSVEYLSGDGGRGAVAEAICAETREVNGVIIGLDDEDKGRGNFLAELTD